MIVEKKKDPDKESELSLCEPVGCVVLFSRETGFSYNNNAAQSDSTFTFRSWLIPALRSSP